MLRIGLTGGIASGKSTVAALLRELGAPVVDADILAHQVLAPGAEALQEVRATFGPQVFRRDGSLDRHALGQIIFGDDRARTKLNVIVHPRVRTRMAEAVERLRSEGARAVVLDIPLLIESRLLDRVDQVWVVWAPQEVQIERLIARNGFSREEALSRIMAQMPIDEKKGYADVVIENTGSRSALKETVRRLWQQVLNDARA